MAKHKPKSRPTLICLGGGIESIPMLNTLSQEYRLIVLDWNDKCSGALWVESNAKQGHLFIRANVYNPTPALKAFNEYRTHYTYTEKFDVDGVLCTATDCPDTQAAFAEYHRLPTIGKYSAEAGRDKWVQLERLSEAGLPVPESKHIDVRATWDDLEGFDIIKPVASRGARGVQRINKDQFNKQIFAALSESLPGYKRMVAQKFVEGIQLSTESIVYEGEIIFTCFALRNYEYLDRFRPFIIENGCDTPFFISSDSLSLYNDLILKSADVLGWNNWTIKGDLVLRPDGQWTIIELAPRLSGGLLSSNIIPDSYGYDYVSSFAGMSVGEYPFEVDDSHHVRYSCQRYLFPDEQWIGKRISSLPPASNGMRYYKSIGDKIEKVTSHANRLGQVIVTAGTMASAKEKAEKAVKDTLSQIKVG